MSPLGKRSWWLATLVGSAAIRPLDEPGEPNAYRQSVWRRCGGCCHPT
jgi:hypothetical protein